MAWIPSNPDALLTRTQAADALKESGYPVASTSLATRASRGGGPRYRKFGTRVLYKWEDLVAWAEGRLSEPRSSSSEADARPQRHKARGAGTRSARPREEEDGARTV
jgi:hypothetical protein